MQINMNPDQTAPLGTYYLQYRLPKIINKREKQTTKVVPGRVSVKHIYPKEDSVKFCLEVCTFYL